MKLSLLVGLVAVVVVASAGGDVAQRSIESDIERLGEEAAHSICVFAVGKLEGDLNGWVCAEVGAEAIGLAAGFLAETGLLEIAEDPLVGATASYFCTKGLSILEQDSGLDANSVCADIGLSRRRRDVSAIRSRKTTQFVFNSTDDVTDAWAYDTTGAASKYLAARKQYMASKELPTVVFSDGTFGYCLIGAGGLYTCVDSGYSSNIVSKSASGRLAQTALQQQQSTQSSGTSSGAVAAIVVLAVVVVLVALYAVRLHIKVGQLEDTAVSTDAQNLMVESGTDDSGGVEYAQYTDN